MALTLLGPVLGLCADLTIFMCVVAGKISSPVVICTCQTVCRGLVILFGDQ